jgi:hypothetical protein
MNDVTATPAHKGHHLRAASGAPPLSTGALYGFSSITTAYQTYAGPNAAFIANQKAIPSPPNKLPKPTIAPSMHSSHRFSSGSAMPIAYHGGRACRCCLPTNSSPHEPPILAPLGVEPSASPCDASAATTPE